MSVCVCVQLFLGDTNRTISETPMNMASSRSHCVFTIYVEARQVLFGHHVEAICMQNPLGLLVLSSYARCCWQADSI